MNRSFTCCLLTLLLLTCAACGGPSTGAPAPQAGPALRVVSFPGSDWQPSDLQVATAPAGQGISVALSSRAAIPARTLLLELQFDPAWQAEVVSAAPALDQAGALSLLATVRPGVAGIGVLLPAGEALTAGPLLSLRLVPATALARSAANVPQNLFGQVPDLAATLDSGNVRLDWTYRNRGDCDQNSEVNVADITPLSTRLHQRTDDGVQDDTDVVLDADTNGEINAADLSTIGQNYHGTVLGYNIYRADAASLDNPLKVGGTAFPLGSPNPHTRRAFSATLTAAEAGTGLHFFFVRAVDTAAGAGNEGAVSNAVQADLAPPQPPKFELAPPGQQEPDAAGALSPSLVIMPQIAGVSQAGAPVVVYLSATGVLTLAYYNSGAWVKTDISGGATYLAPQALWTGTGGLVLAFEPSSQKLRVLSFDNLWVSTGNPGGAYTAGVADVPGLLDADYDAASGKVGVVAAYTTANGQHIVYSELNSGSWTNSEIYAGSGQLAEILGGISFRFDPQGGQPWCVYSVGTTDIDLQNIKFDIATTLSLARFDGTQWTSTPVSYPDSPLQLDLGFDAAGTARLAMNAARNYHLTIPLQGSYDLSVLLDGTVGDYNGTTFAFPANPVYKSDVAISFTGGFPPTGITITLNLATGASLSGPAGVTFGLNSGALNFDTSFNPTGGSLTPDSRFYTNSTGSWNASSYYTGSAGRNFIWLDNGTGGLSTAYLQGVTLDSTNLGQLTSGIASSLEFWST
jgi:hypothetical protein